MRTWEQLCFFSQHPVYGSNQEQVQQEECKYRVMLFPRCSLSFRKQMKTLLFFWLQASRHCAIFSTLVIAVSAITGLDYSDCIYSSAWRQGTNPGEPRNGFLPSVWLKPQGNFCCSMCTGFNACCRFWLSSLALACHAGPDLNSEHPVVHTKVAKELYCSITASKLPHAKQWSLKTTCYLNCKSVMIHNDHISTHLLFRA